MIFFIPEGRLGNQIFQYLALVKIAKKNETVVVFGFDELSEVFETEKIIRVPRNGKISRFGAEIFYKALFFLAHYNLISVASVKREVIDGCYAREGNGISWQKGLISSVILLDKGTFHSEAFFDEDDAIRLKIRQNVKEKAKHKLEEVTSEIRIFIHLRFGDYKDFKVYGNSPILPVNYYRHCMKEISHSCNPCFLVFSDDPAKAQNLLGDLNGVIFLNGGDFKIDFAMMAQCDGAILSASSFGWWAAYFMSKKNIIYAPEHWLGFLRSIDYPKQPCPEFFKKIDVHKMS